MVDRASLIARYDEQIKMFEEDIPLRRRQGWSVSGHRQKISDLKAKRLRAVREQSLMDQGVSRYDAVRKVRGSASPSERQRLRDIKARSGQERISGSQTQRVLGAPQSQSSTFSLAYDTAGRGLNEGVYISPVSGKAVAVRQGGIGYNTRPYDQRRRTVSSDSQSAFYTAVSPRTRRDSLFQMSPGEGIPDQPSSDWNREFRKGAGDDRIGQSWFRRTSSRLGQSLFPERPDQAFRRQGSMTRFLPDKDIVMSPAELKARDERRRSEPTTTDRFFMSGYQEIRDRPLQLGATFLVGGGFGATGKALSVAQKSSRFAAVGTKVFTAGSLFAGLTYGGSVASGVAFSGDPGGVLGRETIRAGTFTGGYYVGSHGGRRLAGWTSRTYARIPKVRFEFYDSGKPGFKPKVWDKPADMAVLESPYADLGPIIITRKKGTGIDWSIGKKGSMAVTRTIPRKPMIEVTRRSRGASDRYRNVSSWRDNIAYASSTGSGVGYVGLVGVGGLVAPTSAFSTSVRSSSLTRPAQLPGSTQAFSFAPKAAQRQSLIPDLALGALPVATLGGGLLLTSKPSLGGGSRPILPVPRQPPPGLSWITPRRGSFRGRRAKGLGTGRGFGYSPSLYAIEFGVRGRAPRTPIGGFSGFELRPLTGKKRKRRKARRL